MALFNTGFDLEEVSNEEKKDKTKGKKVTANNSLQKNYVYYRTAKEGEWKDKYPEFKPELTPNEMLRLGVFEGKYLNDCKDEFPPSLFKGAKVKGVDEEPDPSINYFGIKSRQHLSVWEENGWIKNGDKYGWFQWYCRFYYGRRDSEYDEWQIGRWKSFVARHGAQVEKNCRKGDDDCRRKQKQALLQWGMDPKKL